MFAEQLRWKVPYAFSQWHSCHRRCRNTSAGRWRGMFKLSVALLPSPVHSSVWKHRNTHANTLKLWCAKFFAPFLSCQVMEVVWCWVMHCACMLRACSYISNQFSSCKPFPKCNKHLTQEISGSPIFHIFLAILLIFCLLWHACCPAIKRSRFSVHFPPAPNQSPSTPSWAAIFLWPRASNQLTTRTYKTVKVSQGVTTSFPESGK